MQNTDNLKRAARWLTTAVVGAMLFTTVSNAQGLSGPVFRKTGSNKVESFAAVSPAHRFDVVNAGKSYLMLVF